MLAVETRRRYIVTKEHETVESNSGAQQGAETENEVTLAAWAARVSAWEKRRKIEHVEELIGEKVTFVRPNRARCGRSRARRMSRSTRKKFVGKVLEQAMTPGHVIVQGDDGSLYNRAVSDIEVMT